MTNALATDRELRPPRFVVTESSTSRTLRLALGDDPAPLPIFLVAGALCLAIGIIHIQDQGGFLGDVTPEWIKFGYYAVEVGAAITMAFLIRQKALGWVLGLFVSAGPFISYVLSRSVGLPGDSGDIGNWGYTLGTVSLIVEGALFVLCAMGLIRVLAGARRAANI